MVRALQREGERQRRDISVITAGCTGMCYDAVQVTLRRPDQPDVTWGRVRPADAEPLIAMATGATSLTAVDGAFAWHDEPHAGLSGSSAVPFLAGQRRVLLSRAGRCDPVDVDEALTDDGYRGLALVLAGPPEATLDAVKQSGLAGRGGAYFPAARKWEGCQSAGEPRYLIVNAEEGEPGVFKDRHLLESDPHRVIEGMLIAAYTMGASRVVVYVNGQATLARERLTAALTQARRRGLIGKNILGAAFLCDIDICEGAGGYVLGEESVILESVEGHRPMPRIRPPYPVEVGLRGRPTAINNVETLANLPLIVTRGAPWFAEIGSPRFPGTKLVCVSGDVVRPGLVEVEIGTTLQTVIELAGGVSRGRSLQAVLTGGPSGTLVPPRLLNTPLEPRHPEVLLGSGNVIAIDETRSLLEVVRRLAHFNAAESCGKCTPCREGCHRMSEILDRVAAGRPQADDRARLLALGEIAASASICGLGQMAPNPILSALRHFSLAELDGARRNDDDRTDG